LEIRIRRSRASAAATQRAAPGLTAKVIFEQRHSLAVMAARGFRLTCASTLANTATWHLFQCQCGIDHGKGFEKHGGTVTL